MRVTVELIRNATIDDVSTNEFYLYDGEPVVCAEAMELLEDRKLSKRIRLTISTDEHPTWASTYVFLRSGFSRSSSWKNLKGESCLLLRRCAHLLMEKVQLKPAKWTQIWISVKNR